MDIPDLVKGALGDEEIQASVSLGDEDAVCLTPARTLVYRGEGLLSDERVEDYSHDIEQLAVSEGRRKTKFTMQYIDGTESFTVPANRGEKVLELFLEGVLRLEGVIESHESLAGVYRFSELTLVIAEGRLVKHIGNQVWTEDYEVYPYEDVTGLEFERASVATSIALTVDGRPQRVKVPNGEAPVVRQTLEQALFGYYDVGSLEDLDRVIGTDDAPAAGGVETAESDDEGELVFGDDFDPLVSDETEEFPGSVDADDQLAADASRDDAGAHQTERDDRLDRPSEPPENRPGENRSTEGPSGQSSGANADRSAGVSGDSPDRPNSGDGHPDGSNASGQRRSSDTASTEAGASDAPDASTANVADAADAAAAADTAASTSGERREGGSSSDQSRSSPDRGSAPATDRQSDDPDRRATESGPTAAESAGTSADADRSARPGADSSPDPDSGPRSDTDAGQSPGGDAVSREEYEALAERVDELTDAVDRQNELLERQHRALKQLVEQRQQSE